MDAYIITYIKNPFFCNKYVGTYLFMNGCLSVFISVFTDWRKFCSKIELKKLLAHSNASNPISRKMNIRLL